MFDSWMRRVDDILENIERIKRLLHAKTETDFYNDEALYFAVERLLQNIGEATLYLPDHVKEAATHIPWHEIRGMRNILVHGYNIVDEVILWKTVHDLDDLERYMNKLKHQ